MRKLFVLAIAGLMMAGVAPGYAAISTGDGVRDAALASDSVEQVMGVIEEGKAGGLDQSAIAAALGEGYGLAIAAGDEETAAAILEAFGRFAGDDKILAAAFADGGEKALAGPTGYPGSQGKAAEIPSGGVNTGGENSIN